MIQIIQKEVNQIVDTSNFYVALYNKETDMFSFPYYSDSYDSFSEYPAKKTLTKIVVETKRPLLANKKTKEELVKKDLLEFVGTRSKIWLGVPLKFESEIFGVFAVQNYENENAYNEEDMRIMEIIADQISVSIHRKQTEEKLKFALIKATESERLKTSFLQNISHEIRTPMNGLLGFTGLMMNDDISSEDMGSYVKIIHESGNRMLNTLRDVMDISFIETDMVEISKSVVNVNDELQSQYDDFIQKADSTNIKLTLSNGLPHINAAIKTDYNKFNTIISKILINAFKYTNEGFVDFGYVQEGRFLKFYVKDSGCGIPPDRTKAIFNKFIQSEIADIKVKEGTGLGLSIAKAYVHMLGGKIWVESEENIGSAFFFTLPYNEVKRFDDKQINIAEKEEVNNLKVLIVEDEGVSSEFLTLFLNKYCSEILLARNGEEAIRTAKQNPDLDLILMDIKLPKINGNNATKEIRKFNKDVTIVAQTAYYMPKDKKKAIDAGCNYFITKPIDTKLLENIIHKITNE